MSLPSLAVPRLPRKILVLSGVLALMVALLPWLGVRPASASITAFEIDGNLTASTDTDWNSAVVGTQPVEVDGSGAADSTVFTAASKEDHAVSSWGSTNGAPGADNDIINVYSYADTIGTDSFLWFGWTRTNPKGTDTYYLELDKNANLASGKPDRSGGAVRFRLDDQGSGVFTLVSIADWSTGTSAWVNRAGAPVGFRYADSPDDTFVEAEFNLTKLLSLTASCPAAFGYINFRNTTGNELNLKDYIAGLSAPAGSSCATINIDKQDSAAGHAPLGGATFTVSPNPLPGAGGTYTVTDGGTHDADGTADGKITITGVVPGVDYTITETVAPSHYAIDAPAAQTTGVLGNNANVTKTFSDTRQTGNLTIDKGVDNANAVAGDTLTYTMAVDAAGAIDQTNVTVTDEVPSTLSYVTSSTTCTGPPPALTPIATCMAVYDSATRTLTWTIGTIAAGSSVQLTFQATVDAIGPNADGSVDGEIIDNTANATSDLDADSDSARTTVSAVPVAGDLTIQKDVDKATAPYGSTLTYTLRAGATGTRNQLGVRVDDILPAEVDYVLGSATCAAPCTASYDSVSRTITWLVGSIPANTSRNDLTFQAIIKPGTIKPDGSIDGETVDNVAAGSSTTTASPVTDDAVTTVPAVAAPPVPPATAPDLHLAKVSSPASGTIVQHGDRVDYTVTVTNTGNGAATGQTLTDTLPAGLTLVSGSASPAPTSVSGQTLTWTVDVPAQSGATPGSVTVTYAATVDKNAAPGATLTNAATLAGLAATTDHHVAAGDLTLVKRVAESSAEYGDTLHYSFTAAATGTSDQHNVVVSDVLPDGTTYVDNSAGCTDAGTCTASYDDATRTVTWSLGDIAAGDSRELGFSATIDTPHYDPAVGLPAKVVHNVATIAADGFAAAPSNEVKTPLVAVLGVKVVRKPPTKNHKPTVEPTSHSRLPFTGSNLPVWPATAIALMLITIGTGLTVTRRRRPGAHS